MTQGRIGTLYENYCLISMYVLHCNNILHDNNNNITWDKQCFGRTWIVGIFWKSSSRSPQQGKAQFSTYYGILSKQVTNLCDVRACKLLVTFWSSPGEDYPSCTKLFADHKSQMGKQPFDNYAWGCVKWESSRHQDDKIKHKCEPTKEVFQDSYRHFSTSHECWWNSVHIHKIELDTVQIFTINITM